MEFKCYGRLDVQERPTSKTPYSDDTTHIIFEPLDFIAMLTALVPKPRVTRVHVVIAPNSKYRIDLVLFRCFFFTLWMGAALATSACGLAERYRTYQAAH